MSPFYKPKHNYWNRSRPAVRRLILRASWFGFLVVLGLSRSGGRSRGLGSLDFLVADLLEHTGEAGERPLDPNFVWYFIIKTELARGDKTAGRENEKEPRSRAILSQLLHRCIAGA